jgi:hypothetical protein
MANYGRNFEFRVAPRGAARSGRFVASATALAGSGSGGGAAGTGQLVIGAPVVADLTAGLDSAGRQYVKLASQAALSPYDETSNSAVTLGMAGIVVYEYGPAAFAGFDPFLTTYSDLGAIPLGASVQVISGDPTVKVVFTNTAANTFLGIRSYAGRIMVNGLGATSTVAVGDYLVPGLGDDVDGYWQSQSTEEGAWLVITHVDTVRNQVEARMLF